MEFTMLGRVSCISVVVLAAYGLIPRYKFKRTVVESGPFFYKIEMTLGSCAEKKMFMDSKVWPNVRMNRIFDIYYKSSNPYYTVSKVEIIVVTNNTDIHARSEKGVGYPEFTGFVVLPTRSGVVTYTINIYTCFNSALLMENNQSSNDTVIPLPFLGQFEDSDGDDSSDDGDST